MTRRHATRARLGQFATTAFAVAALTATAGYEFGDDGYLASASELTTWSKMLERYVPEQAVLRACMTDAQACPERHKGLHTVLSKGRALNREKQIQLVNRYINRKGYRVDRRRTVTAEDGDAYVQWSQWSTPLEFLRRGGDCEDFATAKYFLLRELGIPAQDLRVVVAFDRPTREYHALLAVKRDAATSWLLETDNHIYRRKPNAYRYVYAVNELGVWDHDTRR